MCVCMSVFVLEVSDCVYDVCAMGVGECVCV